MSGNTAGKKRAKAGSDEHIPGFIKNRPWYVEGTEKEAGDSLAHHRLARQVDVQASINDAFSGGAETGSGGEKGLVSRQLDDFDLGTGGDKSGIRVRDESVLQGSYDAKRDPWYGVSVDVQTDLLRDRLKERDDQADVATPDHVQQEELIRLGLEPQDVGFRASSSTGLCTGTGTVRQMDDKPAYLQDIGAEESLYDPKSRIYKSQADGTVDPKSKMFRRHLTGEALEVAALNEQIRQETAKAGVKDVGVNTAKLDHVLAANPTKYELLRKKASRKSNPIAQTADQLVVKDSGPKRRKLQEIRPTSGKMKDLYDKYM